MKTANRLLAELIIQHDDMPRSIRKSGIPTVAEAVDAFLEYQEVENAKGSYDYYCSGLTEFFDMFGDRQVKSLTSEDGTAFKKEMMAHENWKPETINVKLKCAKILLNWCCKPSRRGRYFIGFNPFEELKLLKSTGRERVLSDAEFEILMTKLMSGKDVNVKGGRQNSFELFSILRTTTMRPQELRRLRWEFIRWHDHRIVFPLEEIKTRNRREVTMLEDTERILRQRQERFIQHGIDVTKGLVFFKPTNIAVGERRRDANSYTEKMFSSSDLSMKLEYLVRKCVKDGTIQKTTEGGTIVPYSFRHSRITELVMENHPFPLVMGEAGHAKPETTMKYVHIAKNQSVALIRAADDKKKKPADDES